MREVLALERVASTARQIAARQEQTDAQSRALVEACCTSVPTTEVFRIEAALRTACVEERSAYHAAAIAGDQTALDNAFHSLAGRVRALCHEMEAAQAQAIRAATVRIEAIKARS